MAPTPFDHLLALTLAVAFPLRAKLVGFKGLVQAAPEDQPRTRRGLYVQAMRIQWGLVLALVVLWLATHRPARALGWAARPTPQLLPVLGSVLAMVAVLFVQARRVAASERSLERVRPKIARMRIMLPHDAADLRLFLWLSLTAGVCEELLYRGFLLFYFGHWLGPLAGLGLTSLIFGLGHLYQGPRGVALTALVGALLGALYMLCGSLFPSMLLHAGGDMYTGWIAHAALSREPAPAEPLSPAAADPPPTP